jgi:hypothetical protein
MTGYLVYCLREVGTAEPRYIGQTIHSPWHRLRAHISEARSGGGRASPFGKWINENVGRIEGIEVARCKTLDEAKAMERHAIIVCTGMGFRLFNSDHRPRQLKTAQVAA